MAQILNDEEVAVGHSKIAEHIKRALTKHLWLEDKRGSMLNICMEEILNLSRHDLKLWVKLYVLYLSIFNAEEAKIVSSVPVTDYGISCIYPQIPNIPPTTIMEYGRLYKPIGH